MKGGAVLAEDCHKVPLSYTVHTVTVLLSYRKGPQDISSPTSGSEQGQLSALHGLLRSLFLWDLRKGWRLHSFSGEPAPLLGYLHNGIGFPLVVLEPPLLHRKAATS